MFELLRGWRHYGADALRMRASLQRSQRLIEAHTEALIEVR